MGLVKSPSDVAPGTFIAETKVQASSRQKADLVIRAKSDGELVLIEAKAVGVLLDATKRTKECCDKAREWLAAPALGNPRVVAVIGGFFATANITSLENAGVGVVWEHRISDLEDYL